MQVGQGFLMSRAQIKIGGIGGDAEGSFKNPKCFSYIGCLVRSEFRKEYLLANEI